MYQNFSTSNSEYVCCLPRPKWIKRNSNACAQFGERIYQRSYQNGIQVEAILFDAVVEKLDAKKIQHACEQKVTNVLKLVIEKEISVFTVGTYFG